METATLQEQINFYSVQSSASTDPALREQASRRVAILAAELAMLEDLFNQS